MEKASWRKGSRFTKIDPDLAYAEMESIREEEGPMPITCFLTKRGWF